MSSGESINVGYAGGLVTDDRPRAPPARAHRAGRRRAPGERGAGFHSFDAEGYSALLPTKFKFGVVFPGRQDALFTFVTPATGRPDDLRARRRPGRDPSHPGSRVRGRRALRDDRRRGGGGTAILATCKLSGPPQPRVDTVNIALYGANSPFYDERRSAVYDAIAGRSSDLMCVLETAMDVDASSTRARPPSRTRTSSEPISTRSRPSPTTPTATRRPPPAAAPCAGIDPGIVQSILPDCAANCPRPPGRERPHRDDELPLGGLRRPVHAALLPGAAAERLRRLHHLLRELRAAPREATAGLHHRREATLRVLQGMNGTLMLSRYPLIEHPGLRPAGDRLSARHPLRAGHSSRTRGRRLLLRATHLAAHRRGSFPTSATTGSTSRTRRTAGGTSSSCRRRGPSSGSRRRAPTRPSSPATGTRPPWSAERARTAERRPSSPINRAP